MFRYRNFKLIGLNFSGIPTMWSYTTDDTIAQVTAEGYFDDPRLDVEPVDIIKVQASDGPYEVQLVGGVASVVGATDRTKDLSEFGVIYGSSDSQHVQVQAAIDFCESKNITLRQSGNVTLNGNVYIGNLNFVRESGAFNLVSDSSFTESGTSTLKSEGVILTKSSNSAGYGLSSVSISITGGLSYTFDRPDTGGPIAAVLLENVESLNADYIKCVSTDGQATSKTPLDFYSGVQNVSVGLIDIFNYAGASGVGGFWIRNDDLSRNTENIQISKLKIKHTGTDEAIAIFNFVNAAEIKNVKIGTAIINVGSSGQALSVMNKFSGSPGVVDDVTFGDVFISVNGSSSNMFVVKSEACSPVYTKLRVDINDFTGSGGTMYALRGIAPNNEKTIVGNLIVNINDAPTGNFDLISGKIAADNATIKSSNGGFARRVARAFSYLHNCDIECDYTDFSLSVGDSVTGRVVGKMEGIRDFSGTHILDVENSRSGTQWFIHSSATIASRAPEYISYDAKVIVNSASGADTVSNIVSCNFTSSNEIPLRIVEDVDNTAHDITIGNDFRGGDCKLVEYNSVNKLTTGIVRRSLTLDV